MEIVTLASSLLIAMIVSSRDNQQWSLKPSAAVVINAPQTVGGNKQVLPYWAIPYPQKGVASATFPLMLLLIQG